MAILQLSSFPIEQMRNLQQLEERLGQWFAGKSYPVRLLAFSHTFDMSKPTRRIRSDMEQITALGAAAEPVLHAIDAHLAKRDGVPPPWDVFQRLSPRHQQAFHEVFRGQTVLEQAIATQDMRLWVAIGDALATVLWPLPWMKEMIRFYEALTMRHIRSATYMLLTWEPDTTSPESIANTMKLATQRGVQVVQKLPAVIKGPYTELDTKLRPEQPHLPWLQVVTAYDVRGNWDATTLHEVLNAPFDVAISIDISTVGRNAAQRAAEFAYNAARLAISGKQKDVRGERIFIDAQHVMHALTQQSLHDVQISVLVSGDSEDSLRSNVSEIESRMGMALKLTTIAGTQGEMLKLWSTAKKHQIAAPLRTRNMLSNGVGCLAGILGYHRVSGTDGILWGLDAVRRAPIFFDLFSGNAAGHMLILGKTGFGKTWFVNQFTMRGAAIAGWKIIGIDAFKNGERIEGAAGAGARCNWIGLNSVVNIFDIVIDPNEDGWLQAQVAIVLDQLSMLLGQPGRNDEGKEQLLPRVFSITERGVLDRAITALYAEMENPLAPLDQMPILSDLMHRLEQYAEAEAKDVAREIRMLCFGSEDRSVTTPSSLGKSFNGHTTVDWNFGKDVNYFDFHAVPNILRPFYYAQAIGAVNRYMRDPKRDVKRRTLLIIDEFGYVTQVQAVAQMAADICKVARKFGIALIVIDQNPTTFLNNQAGLAIWENTRVKLCFHLDDKPARLVGDNVSDFTPSHVEFLSRADRGQCVVLIDNDVFVMLVETNPKETRAFAGS